MCIAGGDKTLISDFSCKWIAKISLIPCKPLYFPESFNLHSSLISDYQ